MESERHLLQAVRTGWWGCRLALLAVGWALSARTVSAQIGGPPGRVVLTPVDITRIQSEPEDRDEGRYDWGPSVMFDGGVYKMWWTRLGGTNEKRFAYRTRLPDGKVFEFTYPDWGDRIYYAESRDGRTWQISGTDYAGSLDTFGPDASGPCMVMAPAESSQERNHVGCPSVIKVGKTYYMYYEAPADFVCRRGKDGKVAVLREYHSQVFVATSPDGKRWRKYPSEKNPQPIVAAPPWNRRPEAQRYGFGQPCVFHVNGLFVLHYVNSCTGPNDFIVRVEADNPLFRNARVFGLTLASMTAQQGVPEGAVARFAQTDINYLGPVVFLIRPAYGTGRLGLLASRSGVFPRDAEARTPAAVFPQVAVRDTRGEKYGERLFPGFLTDPSGRILNERGCVAVFYSSGLGFKEQAHTWDLFRCDLRVEDLLGVVPQ